MTYKISDTITIRTAQSTEVPLIREFILELARYERLEHQMTASEADLKKTLFEDRRAEVLFCDYEGKTVGFALFFHNYSTFLGKPGLYLEDLFVKPEFRSRGLGKAFFKVLAQIAKDRDCGRIEWWCLDWNQKSIDFYLGLGAQPMCDWTTYRIPAEGFDTLRNLK